MVLNKAQYDEIFRCYDQKQLDNQYRLEQRLNEVYTKIPKIAEINDAIASLSVARAKKQLNGEMDDSSSYKTRIELLTQEKTSLLTAAGYPADYMESKYFCDDCQDTGYIEGKKCHCLKQEIINLLYSQSNIKEILKKENFSAFSYDYYSDNEINAITGCTPLNNIRKVVEICRNFIDNFHTKYENLFFYGEAGVGKTFLCNCIAKELIEQSCSVIYLSAVKLFDILSDAVFKRTEEADSNRYITKLILDCDLLIIDDLGTELTNSFTNSSLFNCINERCLNKKPVIMSTNLSIAELQKNYSERTFSRITSNYTLLKIYGDDIRVRKKLEG